MLTPLLALTGTAHAATTTVTAVTHLTQRPDSGYSGNVWALDNLQRTASVTVLGVDPTLTDCGATATACYEYSGTISDTGTAYATDGQTSPGADAVPITNSPSAAVTGNATVTFDASSESPDAALVPATLSGAGDSEQSTTNWVEQFFPAGTTFGAGPVLPTWTWKYDDTRDCQTWIDAYNGTQATSGDITGADDCTTSVTDPGNQTVTVGQAASVQVFGSTTSSDTALTYAVTAGTLPDGLTLNSSTGVISGTPKADATSGTVTVTVTDFGGNSASTSFGFTVDQAVITTAPQVPVYSDGSGTYVAPTREDVNWKQSVGSWDELVIKGAGGINGHIGWVDGKAGVLNTGVYAGLEFDKGYTVTITPYTAKDGTPLANAKPGVVYFVS